MQSNFFVTESVSYSVRAGKWYRFFAALHLIARSQNQDFAKVELLKNLQTHHHSIALASECLHQVFCPASQFLHHNKYMESPALSALRKLPILLYLHHH